MNRPVRSPRISVGLECAVALALAGDTTLGGRGGIGGGCRRSRCSLRERGGNNVDVMSPPPIVVGGTWTLRDRESQWVCLSRGHCARSESH